MRGQKSSPRTGGTDGIRCVVDDPAQPFTAQVTAVNGGLLPQSKGVWASLVPLLVPDYYGGGVTSVQAPPAEGRKAKSTGKSKAAGHIVTDRARPEAPIVDEAEAAMMWDRVTHVTPRNPYDRPADPFAPSQGSQTARGLPSSTLGGSTGGHQRPAPSTPRGMSTQLPPLPSSPRTGGPSATPTPGPGRPGGAGVVGLRGGASEERPAPDVGDDEGDTFESMCNALGTMEGRAVTGGLFTVTYPGTVTASGVQPPTTVLVGAAGPACTADNQAQQPRLASGFKQGDRPPVLPVPPRGREIIPAAPPLLMATYANMNPASVGSLAAQTHYYYGYSQPHAVASGPHLGALPVPLGIPGMARQTVPGVLVHMLSPTQPLFVSDEQVLMRDQIIEAATSGGGKGTRSPPAPQHHVPRPPHRPEPLQPEHRPAVARLDEAELQARHARSVLAGVQDLQEGHTFLVAYEREAARRERRQVQALAHDLAALGGEAKTLHGDKIKEREGEYETVEYTRVHTLRVLEDAAPQVAADLAEQADIEAKQAKASQEYLSQLREHTQRFRALTAELAAEREHLTATMTSKLKRTHAEMAALAAQQKTQRQRRAHVEAARLAEELGAMDRRNRALTQRLAALKKALGGAARELELEQQRSTMLTTKNKGLSAKVAAAVDGMRVRENAVLAPFLGLEGPSSPTMDLARRIDLERRAVSERQARLDALRAERAGEEATTQRLRGLLLQRLELRTVPVAAFHVLQGFRALAGPSTLAATTAPEPDIEGKASVSPPQAAAGAALRAIGACIETALEDVMDAIRRGAKLGIEADHHATTRASYAPAPPSQDGAAGALRRSRVSPAVSFEPLPQLAGPPSVLAERSTNVLSFEEGSLADPSAVTPMGSSPLEIKSNVVSPLGGAVSAPPATLGTSRAPPRDLATVRAVLDLNDPVELCLLQDFIAKRVNRRLSHVWPLALPLPAQ